MHALSIYLYCYRNIFNYPLFFVYLSSWVPLKGAFPGEQNKNRFLSICLRLSRSVHMNSIKLNISIQFKM